jgi:DNA-binding HxlR family transcriptional regulator
MPGATAGSQDGGAAPEAPPCAEACCPQYHRAVELLGQRWTGAIVDVLLRADRPLRFGQITGGVPQISDRLLSRRLKELEAEGIVARQADGAPRYGLTPMGRELEPAVVALTAWGRRWLDTSASNFRQA